MLYSFPLFLSRTIKHLLNELFFKPSKTPSDSNRVFGNDVHFFINEYLLGIQSVFFWHVINYGCHFNRTQMSIYLDHPEDGLEVPTWKWLPTVVVRASDPKHVWKKKRGKINHLWIIGKMGDLREIWQLGSWLWFYRTTEDNTGVISFTPWKSPER